MRAAHGPRRVARLAVRRLATTGRGAARAAARGPGAGGRGTAGTCSRERRALRRRPPRRGSRPFRAPAPTRASPSPPHSDPRSVRPQGGGRGSAGAPARVASACGRSRSTGPPPRGRRSPGGRGGDRGRRSGPAGRPAPRRAAGAPGPEAIEVTRRSWPHHVRGYPHRLELFAESLVRRVGAWRNRLRPGRRRGGDDVVRRARPDGDGAVAGPVRGPGARCGLETHDPGLDTGWAAPRGDVRRIAGGDEPVLLRGAGPDPARDRGDARVRRPARGCDRRLEAGARYPPGLAPGGGEPPPPPPPRRIA